MISHTKEAAVADYEVFDDFDDPDVAELREQLKALTERAEKAEAEREEARKAATDNHHAALQAEAEVARLRAALDRIALGAPNGRWAQTHARETLAHKGGGDGGERSD